MWSFRWLIKKAREKFHKAAGKASDVLANSAVCMMPTPGARLMSLRLVFDTGEVRGLIEFAPKFALDHRR
jgi:hypothetical protein